MALLPEYVVDDESSVGTPFTHFHVYTDISHTVAV